MTIKELREHNKEWFSLKNKRFFNDISYRVMKGNSGKFYLVRYTNAWTGLFTGDKPKPHYRIDEIKDNWEIGYLLDTKKMFTVEDVKAVLKTL